MWDSDFSSNKNGGVGKMGEIVLKKGVSLIFVLTNLFQCYLSLSVWCVFVYVFCLFAPFLSVLLIISLNSI